MQDLISVITPCYNAEKYIFDTITLVMQQSYTHWELLVIDDCSTDSSAEIIKDLAKQDDRIKYYKTSSPSGSPSLPRNIGIENAQGKYIAFLDADDNWKKDKLEKQYKYIKEYNVDFVYSNYEKIDSKGNKNDRIVKVRKTTSYKDMLKINSIPCLTSMLSRELIGDKRFKPILNEDFEFWLQILKQGVTAYNINEVTAYYREAENSRSSNKTKVIKSRWNILRENEKIGFLPALYYIGYYAVKATLKYIK
ncbi:MAG: glycosyltransferase family 2 protein [Bacteroidales bacterium]|nr:glycosyltransferase family 2 protein [Bacteroidales bacterium]